MEQKETLVGRTQVYVLELASLAFTGMHVIKVSRNIFLFYQKMKSFDASLIFNFLKYEKLLIFQ